MNPPTDEEVLDMLVTVERDGGAHFTKEQFGRLCMRILGAADEKALRQLVEAHRGKKPADPYRAKVQN
jgi:hypothetical protein